MDEYYDPEVHYLRPNTMNVHSDPPCDASVQSFNEEVCIDSLETIAFSNHPLSLEPPETSEPNTETDPLESMAGDGQCVPLGWEEFSTEEGFLYYFHHSSRSTQWTFPQAERP